MSATAPSNVGGRFNQKERTRRALMAAARELLAEGHHPTISRTADRALVSEATAYRYYSSSHALLHDALAEHLRHLETAAARLRELPSLEDRAQQAAELLAETVLANEAETRALIALYYNPGQPRRTDGQQPSRPTFRMPLINAVLEAGSPPLSPAGLARLRRALVMVIGAEAVLSMRDVAGCSNDEIIATVSWSARQLVRAAVQEE